MSDDPVHIVSGPGVTPEGRRLIEEQRRQRLIRATRPACKRVERQMRRVLDTRDAFRSYQGTGLHADPAKVKAGLLKRHHEARAALRRIIVQEGGTEDAALDAEAAVLDESAELSDKERFRSIIARLREHFKPTDFG